MGISTFVGLGGDCLCTIRYACNSYWCGDQLFLVYFIKWDCFERIGEESRHSQH